MSAREASESLHQGSVGEHAEDDECYGDLFAPEPELALHERQWLPQRLHGSFPPLMFEQNILLWDSSTLVAKWLLERELLHPGSISGRSVAELGAGGGLPSLACALAGASSVVCTEVDENALLAIARAAEYNARLLEHEELKRLQAFRLDWFASLASDALPAFAPVELLICADCNYYERASSPLVATIKLVLAPDGTLLLASRLGRHGLALCLALLEADDEMQMREEIYLEARDDQSCDSNVLEPQDRMWRYTRSK